MNIKLLRNHIDQYIKGLHSNPDQRDNDAQERSERAAYYRSWTADRLMKMTETEFGEYVSKLRATLIWFNKKYIIRKFIKDNGMQTLRDELANLVWGDDAVDQRWGRFRANTKGFGPVSISEILCHVHSKECMLWNRRAYASLNYLGIENFPKYDYQITGKGYVELSSRALAVADEMQGAGLKDVSLLDVDYLIRDHLQVADNLRKMHNTAPKTGQAEDLGDSELETVEFIHNDIRDKIADIGRRLGFESDTEVKVADGSVVDAVWEATIGNMGRVVYVFEVQTKGSIDSLILNLLKSLNNPAVQGVVAVSDKKQLELIKKHVTDVAGLGGKLKCWHYAEVLNVQESLEFVNETINRLGLVTRGF